MADHSYWVENEVRCQPLRSLEEIQAFILNPPAWRSLCRPLTPHSTKLIKNIDMVQASEEGHEISIEKPECFCHFDVDKDQLLRYDEDALPRTLVCHDMANGYHDDACVDGSGESHNYVFYNWAGIDIFCYFSHHLLTVPPLGWINVAHAHGVKVIGTLITEWKDGAAFWDKVLNSPEVTQNLISCLVTIAKTLKFEGWLLNIENQISNPARLLEFIRGLHTALHEAVPTALLIWYDSVTDNGQLNWQNKLNEKNKVFLDACDGLFTNYSWSEQDVADSVAAAGVRRRDVYVGVDVWGRNFYGGGMFNTQKAVKYIHQHACSIAVFAPAWTFEALSDAVGDGDPHAVLHGGDLSRYQRFLLRDRALWGSLWPFLNTRVPSQLPFKTSFCKGRGKKRRMYGEVLSNTPWYNIRHMQYQPNSAHGPHGYLLSSAERLRAAQKMAAKDSQSIVKYRESLYNLNQTLAEDELRKAQECTGSSISNRSLRKGRIGSLIKKKVATSNMSLKSKCSTKIDKLKGSLKNVFAVTPKEVMLQSTTVSTVVSTDDKESVIKDHTYSVNEQLPSIQPKPKESENAASRLPQTKNQYYLAYVAEERECLEEYEDDAFVGGSCLAIHPSDSINDEHRTIRILHCDFTINHSLVVCIATKPVPGIFSQYLTLVLLGIDDSGPQQLVLEGRLSEEEVPPSTHSVISPLTPSSPAYRSLQEHLLLNEPDFYVPVENSFGWSVFYYEVVWPGLRVSSINARTAQREGAVLLGHLGVASRPAPTSARLDNDEDDNAISSIKFEDDNVLA